MKKPSDLPEFSTILDAHEHVWAAAESYEVEDGDTLRPDGPLARDWVAALSFQWDGDPYEAPHVAPLAEIVRRLSGLSGVACPDLDLSEREHDRVTRIGGIDDDA